MSNVVRWGVVGTGRISQTFTRDLALIDAGVVVAVGSRSLASAQNFSREFLIETAYGSYEELVNDPQVDAVYIGTPHPMHAANARLALEAGKPVLVEKAFTMTGDEARELVALSRSMNLFMMEAMWTRFLPHVVALRHLISSGELGDIKVIELDHGKWFEPNPDFRLFAPELGGSAILDLGVYPVSFASMILGIPSRRVAVVDPAFTGVDGQASMIWGYPSGAHAIISCTSLARSAARGCISGTLARVEIAGDFYAPTSFELITRSGETRRYEFEVEGRGLHYQAVEVARCLDAGLIESPVMPLDESIAIMDEMQWWMNQLQPGPRV